MIKCSLDEDDCIDLLTVLRVINQVNQEQAWAIGYQIGALMQRLTVANCAPIESLAQIQLHKEGSLHEKTCSTTTSTTPQTTTTTTTPTSATNNNNTTTTTTTPTTTNNNNTADFHHHHNHHHHHYHHHHHPNSSLSSISSSPVNDSEISTSPNTGISTIDTSTTTRTTTNNNSPPTPPITPELNEILRRRPALNESELVASLGIALFWALDYGIPDDEERKLSIAMEYLIFQSQSKLSLEEVSQICINRLPIATKSHADLHYRQVCKSLISDTIELSMFLEKIYTASMVLSDITLDNRCDISDEDLDELGEPLASLRALRINDWARLWMQVIRELRQRGKFKLTA